MSEDAGLKSRDVVLGLDATWGFAPADQTSPVLARAAGALPSWMGWYASWTAGWRVALAVATVAVIAPADALTVPWPVYAFAAAPIGLLLGAVAAAFPLWFRYRDRFNQFGQGAGKDRSDVAVAYAGLTAGARSRNGDDREYDGNRSAIARAWAVGLIADDVGAWRPRSLSAEAWS